MRAIVKKLYALGKYTLLLAVLSAALHGAVGLVALKSAEKAISKLPTKQVGLHYDGLEQGLCLSKVCLKAKNVSLQFKALGVHICLGDVVLSKGVFSPYALLSGKYADAHTAENIVSTIAQQVLSFNEQAPQKRVADLKEQQDAPEKAACIRLDGSISGTKDFWQINDLRFEQNGFEAALNGDIDVRAQMIRLDGQTQGLADLVSQYIPPNFQLMAQLLLSNKKQDVSIRSDETHVRIFGLPLFPKKYIFNQLFQSIPF